MSAPPEDDAGVVPESARRDAVLILGGDKSGQNSDAFYAGMIAASERIWGEYLAEQERGEHDEE